MLRIIQTGNSLPFSFPVEPSAEFQPGQTAQLTVMGNNVVCGVSDGIAPIGIIDDVKTNAFTTSAVDEVVIAGPIVGVTGPNNTLVTPQDVKAELENPNITMSSFVSDPVDVELIPRNGVVVFLAGTELNFDADGDADMADFGALATAWHSTPDDTNWNTRCNPNKDAIINLLDLFILCENWLEE